MPRRTNGVDNRQVLEFLQLVQELKDLAGLLAIRPAPTSRSRKNQPPA